MNLRHRAFVCRAAAWLACACMAGPVLAQQATANRVPLPAIEAARGEACVADPAFMRRNHMNLLKHQRNETVHLGVRDARASLKGCIECHASAATGSVAQAPGDFCASCHSFAAVKIDCFECHASKPAAAALPANHPRTDTGVSRPQGALRWPQLASAR
jgi:[DsrC]-trisulfide reductase subunit J